MELKKILGLKEIEDFLGKSERMMQIVRVHFFLPTDVMPPRQSKEMAIEETARELAAYAASTANPSRVTKRKLEAMKVGMALGELSEEDLVKLQKFVGA